MSEWKENPGYQPVKDDVEIEVEFNNGGRNSKFGPSVWNWEQEGLYGISRYRLINNLPNLSRSDDGKWYMEIPHSATMEQIANVWEVLNNE